MKSYYFENKRKKYISLLFILLPFGLWVFYILWSMRISRHVVLMKSIPEWTTYITVGLVVGGVFFACSDPYPKRTMESFFGGFSIGLVCSLNIYHVCTYLIPGDIVHYESEYEIVYPGPAIGRFGSRCEAGLWIEDLHTQRWVQLCTNKKELYKKRKQGMDAVRVTAKTNRIGSYIIEYQFMFK